MGGSCPGDDRTVVLFSEMAKCVISLTMLARMLVRGEGKAVGELNLKTALLFSIPGLLYFVNNNIPFYCLMYLEPPSYQVRSHSPHKRTLSSTLAYD